MTWPYWATPLASLASDPLRSPDSNYNSGDYGLFLPHPDTGIWLHQEIFLPNGAGRMEHQRDYRGRWEWCLPASTALSFLWLTIVATDPREPFTYAPTVHYS